MLCLPKSMRALPSSIYAPKCGSLIYTLMYKISFIHNAYNTHSIENKTNPNGMLCMSCIKFWSTTKITKITSRKAPINSCWIIYKVLLLLIVRLVHFLFVFCTLPLYFTHTICCPSFTSSLSDCLSIVPSIIERHIVSIVLTASETGLILRGPRHIIIIWNS